LTQKLKQKEDEMIERLTNTEDKLNEARREQAKSLVLMRQMERNTSREKDRLENMLLSCDSYYRDHIKNLKVQIVSLEKERNILMNTLRQNGNNNNNKMTSTLLPDTSSIAPMTSMPSIQSMGASINLNIPNYDLKSLNLNQNPKHSSLSPSIDNNQGTSLINNKTSYFMMDSNSLSYQSNISVNSTSTITHSNNNNNSSNNSQNLNDEILQHIRNIMGNLELTDIEVDETKNSSQSHHRQQQRQSIQMNENDDDEDDQQQQLLN
jgi:hypothetical protein